MKTVTIGIPAYNEARSLPQLLGDIKKQALPDDVQIQRIIVIDDCSSDETANIAKTWTSLPIQFVSHTKRLGKAVALNEMFELAKTDYLLVFDADVRLTKSHVVNTIVAEAQNKKADLLGVRIQYQRPRTYVQKILAASCDMKNILFESINKGKNIYTCHGRARAFSHALYQSVRIPNSTNEDAYSFLACHAGGFQYDYTNKVSVEYTLPKTYADHAKQALRFRASTKQYDASQKTTSALMYKIPILKSLQANLIVLVQKPILVVYYIVTMMLYVQGLFQSHSSQTWEIASSSKQ